MVKRALRLIADLIEGLVLDMAELILVSTPNIAMGIGIGYALALNGVLDLDIKTLEPTLYIQIISLICGSSIATWLVIITTEKLMNWGMQKCKVQHTLPQA